MTKAEFEALYHLEEGLWWFVGMRRISDALLGPLRKPGLRCLEAGCGAGFTTIDYTRRYDWQVFPCDLSADALAFSADRGLQRLVRTDLTALPYADNSFDAVSCLDVLVMLEPVRARQALAECHRVLKPGGFLLLRTAALERLRGHHSVVQAEKRRYTLPEVEEMLGQVGFTGVRGSYGLFLLFPVVFLKRRLLEPLGLVKLENDVSPTAPWLDFLFRQTLLLEARLLQAGLRLPVGASVLAVAAKPA
jgi:SAM-dependent methyltransferase